MPPTPEPPTAVPPPGPRAGPEHVGGAGALAFLVELAMLVLLALAGWQIGGGTLVSVVRAVAFLAIAVAIWGRWLAPRASHRLARTPRIALKAALFAATAVLGALTGLVVAAVVFAVVAAASLAWGRD